VDSHDDSATLTAAASPSDDEHSPRLIAVAGAWQQIKEHKVIQWGVAYFAAALALAHAEELVAHAYHWPPIVGQILIGLLAIGFLVALVLAWYHGHRGLTSFSKAEMSILAALLIVGAGMLYVFVQPAEHATAATKAEAPSASTAARTSIAVMPFANLTGDPTQDYLGDGMAEELINTLAKVQGLKVPARTSTFAYKGRNTDIRQIAKDLGVGSILEGSVRSAGKRIRITAQLINAQDGLHVWSETYDEQFTDLFTLQDKLAKAIVQALQVNLKGASPVGVAQAPPTQDLEAYQLYLQGSSLADRINEQNLNRAIVYFQQAIARDPKFARAYVGLAHAHHRLAGALVLRPSENYAAAERAARQALALDPAIASAHGVLTTINDFRGNWVEGEVHSAASLSLGGNDGDVRTYRALHLARVGKWRDSLAEARKAVELAPANPWVVAQLASRYSNSGRDAEALKYAVLAVELGYPRETTPLPFIYANAALRAKRYAEAVDIEVRRLNLSDPEQARTAQSFRLVYGALADPRQRARALVALGHLYPARAPRSPPDLTRIAPCLQNAYRYVYLNALDEAYALANQCLDRMAPGALHGIGPWASSTRPFRRDVRFQAFATRLGYMDYWQKYGPPDDCDLKNGKLTCR